MKNNSPNIEQNPEALLKMLDELSVPSLWKKFSIIERDLAKEKLRNIYENLISGPVEIQKKNRTVEWDVAETEDINPASVDEHIHLSETDPHEIEYGDLLSSDAAPVEIQKPGNPGKTQPDLFSSPEKKKSSGTIPTDAPEVKEKQQESIADKIQKEAKIDRLKTAIGINEKFFFINELFDGNLNAYNEAIDLLDSAQTPEESKDLLDGMADKYKWKGHEEAQEQLWSFITRKFK